MVGIRNHKREIVAVQLVYLDPKTGKKHTKAQVKKRTIGCSWGGSAQIHTGKTDEVIFAEGPETGASLVEAKPEANIYISVGNNRNFGLMGHLLNRHSTNTVLFAEDNDSGKANSGSNEGIQVAAKQLAREGITVRGALPALIQGKLTTDYNDILRYEGISSVRTALENSRVIAQG